jgi:hypothetical protein
VPSAAPRPAAPPRSAPPVARASSSAAPSLAEHGFEQPPDTGEVVSFEQQLATAKVPRPSGLYARLVDLIPPGSPVESQLRSPLAFVLAAGVPFVLVLSLGSLLLLGSRDPILHSIDRGGAGSVIESILKKAVTGRTGQDYLMLGHAYARSGQTPQAIIAYTEAGKRGAGDERALDYLVAALDHPRAQAAVGALVVAPSEQTKGKLVQAAVSEAWHLRANALEALVQRREATPALRERAALLDVRLGARCEERRGGLLQLKEHGSTKEALAAIESLREGYLHNARCISIADIEGALLSVQARRRR